jgi:hypothetical protein
VLCCHASQEYNRTYTLLVEWQPRCNLNPSLHGRHGRWPWHARAAAASQNMRNGSAALRHRRQASGQTTFKLAMASQSTCFMVGDWRAFISSHVLASSKNVKIEYSSAVASRRAYKLQVVPWPVARSLAEWKTRVVVAHRPSLRRPRIWPWVGGSAHLASAPWFAVARGARHSPVYPHAQCRSVGYTCTDCTCTPPSRSFRAHRVGTRSAAVPAPLARECCATGGCHRHVTVRGRFSGDGFSAAPKRSTERVHVPSQRHQHRRTSLLTAQQQLYHVQPSRHPRPPLQ